MSHFGGTGNFQRGEQVNTVAEDYFAKNVNKRLEFCFLCDWQLASRMHARGEWAGR